MRTTGRKSRVWTWPTMSTIWLTMPPTIACTSLVEAEHVRSPWASNGERTITRLLQLYLPSPEQRPPASCQSSTSITSAFRPKTISRRKFSFLMLRLEDKCRFTTCNPESSCDYTSEGGVPAAVDEQRVTGDKVRGRTC